MIILLSLQLNYTIARKWNVSFLADVLVYHKYNLAQLSPKYEFAVNFVRDFKRAPRAGVR